MTVDEVGEQFLAWCVHARKVLDSAMQLSVGSRRVNGAGAFTAGVGEGKPIWTVVFDVACDA